MLTSLQAFLILFLTTTKSSYYSHFSDKETEGLVSPITQLLSSVSLVSDPEVCALIYPQGYYLPLSGAYLPTALVFLGILNYFMTLLCPNDCLPDILTPGENCMLRRINLVALVIDLNLLFMLPDNTIP